jgi:hypothetical protein
MFGIEAVHTLQPAREADDEGFGEGETGAHQSGGGFGGGQDDVEVVHVCWIEAVETIVEVDCPPDKGDG